MKYWDGENNINIAIKKKISGIEKNIEGDGGRTHDHLVWSPTP